VTNRTVNPRPEGSTETSSESPEGWTSVRAGDVLGLQNGFPFKPTQWRPVGLPIIRIQNLNNRDAPFNYCFEDVPEKFRVRHGDLLFAWSGTPGTSFGAHVWAGPQAWLNQHIFRVEFSHELYDRDFLRLAINQNLQSYIDQAHGGAGLAHITKAKFDNSTLLLAPLAEQRRIVEKVEALLARVNAARERLQQSLRRIAAFQRSILASAYRGDFTSRGEIEPNDELKYTELGELAEDFSYGSSAKSSASGAVPVLRMGNIQDGKIDWSDLVYTSNRDEIEAYDLRPGDILFNRTNSPELVGKTALYRGERPSIYAGYLIRIRCSANLLPAYLTYCLNSSAGRAFCDRVKTDGVSQSNINATKLRTFPVPSLSVEKQVEIVRCVDAVMAQADTVERRVINALVRTEKVTQAILAKAFTGELVATEAELARRENREYEPASVLLKRTEDERRPAAKASRPARERSRRT
jgi:type I restriction enzyme, S subunit